MGDFNVSCVRAMESVESTLVDIVDMKEQANPDLMDLLPELQHTKTISCSSSYAILGLDEMATELRPLFRPPKHLYGP